MNPSGYLTSNVYVNYCTIRFPITYTVINNLLFWRHQANKSSFILKSLLRIKLNKKNINFNFKMTRFIIKFYVQKCVRCFNLPMYCFLQNIYSIFSTFTFLSSFLMFRAQVSPPHQMFNI